MAGIAIRPKLEQERCLLRQGGRSQVVHHVFIRSKFHSVEQGLFFSMSIEGDVGEKVACIVDCGALRPYMERLICEVRDYVGNDLKTTGNIDLLIISHLDYDHVSGIPLLMNELQKLGRQVHTVVLPYMKDDLKLLIYYWNVKCENIDTPDLQWYRRFLFDPISFFETYGVSTIIFVDASDNDGEESSQQPITDENDKIGPFSLKGVIVEKRPLGESSNVNVYRVKRLVLTLWTFIEFDCWQKPLPKTKSLKQIRREIEDIIQDNGLETVLKRLTDKQLSNKLQRIYRKVWSKLNETSICVAITPTEQARVCWPPTMNLYHVGCCSVPIYHAGYFTEPIFGFMFTGDLSLQTPRTFTAFVKHYENKAKQISVFCVPHHGSEYNWNRLLIDKFRYAQWVISAGLNAGHPHDPVINDLMRSQAPFIWVSEKSTLSITVRLRT
jgi:hypothetical protein